SIKFTKQSLNKIAILGLSLDTSDPEVGAFTKLQHLISTYEENNLKRVKIISQAKEEDEGVFTLAPIKGKQLRFTHLVTGEVDIRPVWEMGIGLIFYFIGDKQTIPFDIESYKKARFTQGLAQFNAHIKGRFANLAEAQCYIQYRNLATSIIRYYMNMDISQPNRKAPADLQEMLDSFNEQKFSDTTIKDGVYIFKPEDAENKLIHYKHLKLLHRYTIYFYWEPWVGLRQYFEGKRSSVGYEIEEYRSARENEKQKIFNGHIQGRGSSLEAARRNLKRDEQLSSHLRWAMKINPLHPDVKLLNELERRFADYIGQQFKIFIRPLPAGKAKNQHESFGSYCFTLGHNLQAIFQGLRRNYYYLIHLAWEPLLGPRIYLLGKEQKSPNSETLGFEIDSLKDIIGKKLARQTKVPAHILSRGDDLWEARKGLINKEYRIRLGRKYVGFGGANYRSAQVEEFINYAFSHILNGIIRKILRHIDVSAIRIGFRDGNIYTRSHRGKFVLNEEYFISPELLKARYLRRWHYLQINEGVCLGDPAIVGALFALLRREQENLIVNNINRGNKITVGAKGRVYLDYVKGKNIVGIESAKELDNIILLSNKVLASVMEDRMISAFRIDLFNGQILIRNNGNGNDFRGTKMAIPEEILIEISYPYYGENNYILVDKDKSHDLVALQELLEILTVKAEWDEGINESRLESLNDLRKDGSIRLNSQTIARVEVVSKDSRIIHLVSSSPVNKGEELLRAVDFETAVKDVVKFYDHNVESVIVRLKSDDQDVYFAALHILKGEELDSAVSVAQIATQKFEKDSDLKLLLERFYEVKRDLELFSRLLQHFTNRGNLKNYAVSDHSEGGARKRKFADILLKDEVFWNDYLAAVDRYISFIQIQVGKLNAIIAFVEARWESIRTASGGNLPSLTTLKETTLGTFVREKGFGMVREMVDANPAKRILILINDHNQDSLVKLTSGLIREALNKEDIVRVDESLFALDNVVNRNSAEALAAMLTELKKQLSTHRIVIYDGVNSFKVYSRIHESVSHQYNPQQLLVINLTLDRTSVVVSVLTSSISQQSSSPLTRQDLEGQFKRRIIGLLSGKINPSTTLTITHVGEQDHFARIINGVDVFYDSESIKRRFVLYSRQAGTPYPREGEYAPGTAKLDSKNIIKENLWAYHSLYGRLEEEVKSEILKGGDIFVAAGANFGICLKTTLEDIISLMRKEARRAIIFIPLEATDEPILDSEGRDNYINNLRSRSEVYDFVNNEVIEPLDAKNIPQSILVFTKTAKEVIEWLGVINEFNNFVNPPNQFRVSSPVKRSSDDSTATILSDYEVGKLANEAFAGNAEAAKQLRKLGKDAVPVLERLLRNEICRVPRTQPRIPGRIIGDVALQKSLLFALAQIKDSESLEIFEQVLRHDGLHHQVLYAAAFGLAQFGAAGRRRLLRISQDRSTDIRQLSLIGLSA
ncbi:MAG: hypothetical protein Q8N14_06815, partial [Candidatus Omnitrophota bacterium]|nr:hypothetical protein [Candidatus Omnitrophota bacterium]